MINVIAFIYGAGATFTFLQIRRELVDGGAKSPTMGAIVFSAPWPLTWAAMLLMDLLDVVRDWRAGR